MVDWYEFVRYHLYSSVRFAFVNVTLCLGEGLYYAVFLIIVCFV